MSPFRYGTVGISMTQALMIHPDNPQQRLIAIAVDVLREGGVIIYPTDSTYALGFLMGDKGAMERVTKIRKLEKDHNYTLVCRDLSEIAQYAQVSNTTFRFLKANTPGAFTFILNATQRLPKRLLNVKRKTVGIRVPNCLITMALLTALDEPLMSTSLIFPGDEIPLTEPHDIYEQFKGLVDIFIDGGNAGIESTTILDMTGDVPVVLRQGKGVVDPELSEG